MKEVHAPVDWLLDGEPWIEYRTRVDLLGQTEPNAQVKSARKAMLASPLVKALVREPRGSSSPL
jgi:hypothetical protein